MIKKQFALHDYQVAFQRNISIAVRDHQRVIACSATGSGKTKTFIDTAAKAIAKGLTVLIISESIKIFRQIQAEISATEIADGKNYKTINSGFVYLAMAQTLQRRTHLIEQFHALGKKLLVIYDECHVATGAAILKALENALVIGFSATPEGKHLREIYRHCVIGPQPHELVNAGMLCGYTHIARERANVAQLRLNSAGDDYSEQSQEEVFESDEVYEGLIEDLRTVKFKKGLIYCASIRDCEHTYETLTAAGFHCARIHTKMDKDQQAREIHKFEKGLTPLMINVAMLTKGYDYPPVDLVVLKLKTKKLSKYIQMCLDMNTEVLTKNGWKSCREIKNGELVASFNMDTQMIGFAPCFNKFERPMTESEKMTAIDTRFLNARITNTHNLVVRKSKSKEGYALKCVNDVIGSGTDYKIPIAGFSHNPDLEGITDAELRFIGWFLSDGTLNKKTGQIMISQSLSQPKYLHESIENTLRQCGFKFGKYIAKRRDSKYADMVVYYVSKGSPKKSETGLRGWGELEALLDKNLSDSLLSISRRQLLVLLETLNHGDGNKFKTIKNWRPSSLSIAAGNNKIFADRMQMLCVINGVKCNISTLNYNKSPLYILRIKDKNFHTIKGKYEKKHNRFFIEDGEGINELVWCLSTIDGTLITRRNGKVLIMGNCGRGSRVLEHERSLPFDQRKKKKFTVLDYGQNWKPPHYNWDYEYEWAEIWQGRPPKRQGVPPVKYCPRCEYLCPASAKKCPNCGHEFLTFNSPQEEPEQPETVLVEVTREYNKLTNRKISELNPHELSIYAKTKNKKIFAIRVARAHAQTDPEFLRAFGAAMNYKWGWAQRMLSELPTEKIEYNDIVLR